MFDRKEWLRKVYQERLGNGQCAVCGRVMEPHRLGIAVSCQVCLDYQKSRYARIRQRVVDGYGGKCYCCGETEPCFLTLDHVNNDGAEHRRKHKAVGMRLYQYLIRNKFPPEFQLLCFNCNCGRQINNGVCPHGRKGVTTMGPEHHLSYAIYQLTRVQNYLLNKQDATRADINAAELIGVAQNAVRAEQELHKVVRLYKGTKSGLLPSMSSAG